MKTMREIENEAEHLLRYVATDRLPVDPGAVAKMVSLLRQAKFAGYAAGLSQGRADGYFGNLPPCPECREPITSGDGHKDNCHYAQRG